MGWGGAFTALSSEMKRSQVLRDKLPHDSFPMPPRGSALARLEDDRPNAMQNIASRTTPPPRAGAIHPPSGSGVRILALDLGWKVLALVC